MASEALWVDGADILIRGTVPRIKFTISCTGGNVPKPVMWQADRGGTAIDFPAMENEVSGELLQMKTIACITGILMALSLATALGEDKKTELSTTGQVTKTETVRGDNLSAAKREKLAKQVLLEKSPDRIVGKRFVFSGPLLALARSENPLQTFNPFAVSNSDTHWDNFRRDPYLPPLRGITLFRLEF